MKTWKKLNSKIVHTNDWFKIRKDQVIQPDGKKGEYNYVVSRPAVVIVAMTDKKELYVIQQYRYPVDLTLWEFPAGGIEKETALAAAKRELLEETGLTAKKWEKLGVIAEAKSFSDGQAVIFLATGLTQTAFNKQKEEGILRVKKVKVKELLKMVETGQFKDAISLAALTMVIARIK